MKSLGLAPRRIYEGECAGCSFGAGAETRVRARIYAVSRRVSLFTEGLGFMVLQLSSAWGKRIQRFGASGLHVRLPRNCEAVQGGDFAVTAEIVYLQ